MIKKSVFKSVFAAVLFMFSVLFVSTAAFAAVGGAAPFINTWLIAGEYDYVDGDGYNYDYVGEASIQPVEGSVSGGKTWEYFDDRLFSRNLDDYEDLYSYYKIKKNLSINNKVAYAHVYVYYSGSTSQSAYLRLGINSHYKAWFNGTYLGGSTNSTRRAYKDDISLSITLQPGWNRILLKTVNPAYSWGFYARICGNDGAAINGLTYSVSGGSGALAVSTKQMGVSTNNMPNGYVDWPYVWMTMNVSSYKMHDPQASKFRFNAQGGQAPYTWSVTSGSLPVGLTLSSSTGEISGKPTAAGTYNFTIRVTDSNNNTASKTLSIEVKERPNKWLETSGWGSLIHWAHGGYNHYLAGTFDFTAFMNMKQSLGFGYGAPTSDASDPYTDPTNAPYVAYIKNELTTRGMKFALYNDMFDINRYDDSKIDYINDWQATYQPVLFWFDLIHPNTNNLASQYMEHDAIYSSLKTRDPDVLILTNNGAVSAEMRGDTDILESEDGGPNDLWARFPTQSEVNDIFAKNPKKLLIESWRFPDARTGIPSYTEYLKVMYSLKSEGFIPNLDYSCWDTDTNRANINTFRTNMNNWLHPRAGVSLSEVFTGTTPGPLTDGSWGYDLYNAGTDTLYIVTMNNPRGKTGLPSAATLTAGPLPSGKFVENVEVMNTGEARAYTQSGPNLTINIQGMSQDPAVTIFKIKLSGSASLLSQGKTAAASSYVPGHEPSKASDGNTSSTAWFATSGSYPQWWQVDLGSVCELRKFSANWYNEAPGRSYQYRVEVSSDGSTFTTVADRTNNTVQDYTEDTFTASARYVRITVTGCPQGGTAAAFEFKVFGWPLVSQGKTAAASSYTGGYEPSKAVDGNTSSTAWFASNGSYPQWWQVDLGAVSSLKKLIANWYNEAPGRSYQYRVEVSSDGSMYTTVADRTNNTAQSYTEDILNVAARYVRITVTGCPQGGNAAAWEFKVYGI